MGRSMCGYVVMGAVPAEARGISSLEAELQVSHSAYVLGTELLLRTLRTLSSLQADTVLLNFTYLCRLCVCEHPGITACVRSQRAICSGWCCSSSSSRSQELDGQACWQVHFYTPSHLVASGDGFSEVSKSELGDSLDQWPVSSTLQMGSDLPSSSASWGRDFTVGYEGVAAKQG